MAGHSKFKNIQHRKGTQDKRRAKIFNKIAREITVAARLGAPDPDMNPRLRSAIIAARQANMPNDRINRAIQSALPGSNDNADYSEIRYEGYGPGGVAVIVEALTDNRNRTAGEIRLAFSRNGGVLGETNSVSFMFEHVGRIVYPSGKISAEEIFEAAVLAGAENVETDGGEHEIVTSVESFGEVRAAMQEKFGDALFAQLVWVPGTTVTPGEEEAADLMTLIEALEDNDDVQQVFANFDIDEKTLERLAG